MHGWNLKRRRKGTVAPDVDIWAIHKHTMSAIQNMDCHCFEPREAYVDRLALRARSYQPGSNSHKDSATLVSLKRRNAPAGLVRDDSGPDPSPPPETTPDEPFIDPLTDDAVSSENLASTIDNVGDDAGHKNRYSGYFGLSRLVWVMKNTPRSNPEFTKTSRELSAEFKAGLNAVVDDTEKILNDDGSAVDRLQYIDISFERTLESRMEILSKLKTLLGGVASGKTLEGQLAGVIESVGRFDTEQKKLHVKIMESFGVVHH
ncbi:hypothetical protein BASA60_007569 [Batrachochytrium salamandrivorans]|nr:hypothetical protein BASA60_007569 [Batrachochytrium salamandrivorans]